jgi:hypothetical protein
MVDGKTGNDIKAAPVRQTACNAKDGKGTRKIEPKARMGKYAGGDD